MSVGVNEQADGKVAVAYNGNAYGECTDVVVGCLDASAAVSPTNNADAGLIALSGTGQATSRTIGVSGTGSAVGGCQGCLWPGAAVSGTSSANGGTVGFSGVGTASGGVLGFSGVGLANAAVGTVPAAPSAPLGNTSLVLATPIQAEDVLEAPAVPLPTGGTVTFLTSGGSKDCKGCLARNVMAWKDYGGWESVRTKQSVNLADEVIGSQDLHAALISSAENKCYEGNTRWNNSWSGSNRGDSSSLSSGSYTAWSDKWTLASGHNWYEDGIHWMVNEGNDICKQF